MPGLLPDVDPDGLLEYSVVFTDRALNQMSQKFQGVMRDLSSILKEVYTPVLWPWFPAAARLAWNRWRASLLPAKRCW